MIARWWALAGALAIVSIACGTSSPVASSATGTAGGAGAAGATGGAGIAGVTGGAGNAGTQGAMGGAGAADSGQPTGSAGAGIGGSGGLAPGTCGIHRRISLPSAPPNATAAAPTIVAAEPDRFVQRVAGGFAVGPWRDTTQTTTIPFRLNWLRVDLDGGTQTPYSVQSSVVGLQSFNMVTPNRVVEVAQYDFYEFRTVILDDAGTTMWGAAKLFEGEDTKFAVAHGAASLDGQRGLVMFADSHPPWLAMFAADGTSVGDVLETTTKGTCYSVVPTAQGAAFASVEGATLHLIERSATGTTALDVGIPLAIARANDCPTLALTDDGFAFLAFETKGDLIYAWTLHRIAHDGTTSVEPWDALPPDCKSVALALKGDTAIATCATASEASVFKRTDGHDQRFAIERAGTMIHSEPGSLFLDVTYAQPIGGTGPPREIIEIRCAD